MNKQFTVTFGPVCNRQTVTIELNGVLPDESLTPKLARRAARVATGTGHNVTVWSNDPHGYRLYRRSARKLRAE